MKLFIGFLLLSSLAHARPHTLLNCAPTDGRGLSAKFNFDGFDDKYSVATVYRNGRKLFTQSGDTSLNRCLEVDMSWGSDGEEVVRDVIIVLAAHQMANCPPPFQLVRLVASGKFTESSVTGLLRIQHNNKTLEENVKCLVSDRN